MKISSENNALSFVHSLVREWFLNKVGLPSKPQIQSWPPISAGISTLICAPTGSGKTLSAFLPAINQLVIEALEGTLQEQTQIIYVSPLKALSNDVQKNLIEPLAQIAELACEKGIKLQNINVGLRTGDTAPHIRRAMLKKPPHILVTTPESLYILLTAEKSRENLQHVGVVIVDEIHALARDKRGVHLSLTLERLEALVLKPVVRIGLSATQKPIELIAQFLTGAKRSLPAIVDIGHDKERKLFIEVPKANLSAVATNEIWTEIYDRLAHLALSKRSILIFTNTRRLAERIAHNLCERLGPDVVCAHHGSLAMKIRFDVENKLKEGKLKALVATASLELGIDIGKLDLVCQIGSPRAIAVALQRVGRAGHWHGGISEGHFFPTTRDELLESAALTQAISAGSLDALRIPRNSLDILAQQIVAIIATGPWHVDDLFELVTRAFCYKELKRCHFDAVVLILSEGISGSRGRYGAYLFYDQVNQVLSARRKSRLVSLTNGGAIADNGLFTVIAEPQNIVVGTLDEDFAVESSRGDIILLGTTSWRIKRVEGALGRVVVEDAHGAPPNVPFWRGEAPGRTDELSLAVSNLAASIGELIPNFAQSDKLCEDPKFLLAHTWLKEQCHLDDHGAWQIVEYIFQGRALLGAIPSQDTIIAERFFDEGGGMQLVIHAPFGARINKAWGLALRKKFCRSFNFELQASATDNGLNIALLEQHSFPLDEVFQFLNPKTARNVVTQAVLQSPLFQTRWRFVAMRSLSLIKFRNGKKVPPNILRMLSDDLLASVFPDAAACQDNLPAGQDLEIPEHPLLTEVINELLEDPLDVEGFCLLLERIYSGSIKCLSIDTPLPSVFAHEIFNANPYAFLDDAPLEERRARAVSMRRLLPNNVLGELAQLDSEIIEEVSLQAWPDIRSKEELHDLLVSLVLVPERLIINIPSIHEYCDELVASRRAAQVTLDSKTYWIAAEPQQAFSLLHPKILIPESLAQLDKTLISRESAVLETIKQWMYALGPTSCEKLADLLMIESREIDHALLKLESTGLILRGRFTSASAGLEWCERRLLARIHRLTVEKLRKEIVPISAAHFVHWLFRWQHLAPGTQLKGKKGLLALIKQLQGFELPANAWENQIFKPRMIDYHPDLLENLGLKGLIAWGRLSRHPSFSPGSSKEIKAKSTALITFFVREDALWQSALIDDEESLNTLSGVAKKIYRFLKMRGASFFQEILRGVGHLAYEVEAGLWQLVAAGLICADDFDNIRLMFSARRRAQGLRRSTSRWTILGPAINPQTSSEIENLALLLLNRYGVVFREILVREKNIPTWRELLTAFRRLEDRGEVRGGRFVSGFVGEQFALPLAVESLRRSAKSDSIDERLDLFAVDPLNLRGILLPGRRIPAFSHKALFLHKGIQQEAISQELANKF